MKKFEMLRELPKCDTETRSELLENDFNRLDRCRVATNLHLKKKSAKHSTTRYTCRLSLFLTKLISC